MSCFWQDIQGATQVCGVEALVADGRIHFDREGDTLYGVSEIYWTVWDTDEEAPAPYAPEEPSYDPELQIDLLDLDATYTLPSVNDCGNAVSLAHVPGVSLGTSSAYTMGTCESGVHRFVLATITDITWPIGAPGPTDILNTYVRADFTGSTSITVTGEGSRALQMSFELPDFPFEPNFEDDAFSLVNNQGSDGTHDASVVNFGADWAPGLPVITGIRFGISANKSGTASGTVSAEFTEAILMVPPVAAMDAKVILDRYWSPGGSDDGYLPGNPDLPLDDYTPTSIELRIAHYAPGATPFVTPEWNFYKPETNALPDGVYFGRLVMLDAPETTVATLKIVAGSE